MPSDGLDELLEREERIERAQRNAYYEIGMDLGFIRDKQLYKVERPEVIAGRYSLQTFEEFGGTGWTLPEGYGCRVFCVRVSTRKK